MEILSLIEKSLSFYSWETLDVMVFYCNVVQAAATYIKWSRRLLQSKTLYSINVENSSLLANFWEYKQYLLALHLY